MSIDHEQEVVEYFKRYAFTLEKIKEKKKQRRPDFRSDSGGKVSYLELKTRAGDPELLKIKDEILAAGDVYAHGDNRDISTGNVKAVNDSVESGVGQLKSLDDGDFNFLIFYLKDIHSQLTLDRIIKALYGAEDIVYTSNGAVHYGLCLFLNESTFREESSGLDGVFILRGEEAYFLCNPFSVNYEFLSGWKAVKSFKDAESLISARFNFAYSELDLPKKEKLRILAKRFGVTVISASSFSRDFLSKYVE